MSIKTNLVRSLLLWTAFALVWLGLGINSPDIFSLPWFAYFIGVFTIIFVINDVADGAYRRGERRNR